MKKLSIFLVVCMLVSLFPAGLALAQETSAILRYEIEDSEHNGSAPQGGQNGATGANGGTVLYLSAGGEATLTVDGGVGGEKRIAVRASSGMGNPTQISMAVNGEPVDTKELWPTPGDWLIFRQVFFFANLNPGQNTITLSIAGDGANFDNIEISNKGYLYDFEEADETDPSASAYGHATFSGLGLTPMRASKATFSNVYTQTSGKKEAFHYLCLRRSGCNGNESNRKRHRNAFPNSARNAAGMVGFTYGFLLCSDGSWRKQYHRCGKCV